MNKILTKMALFASMFEIDNIVGYAPPKKVNNLGGYRNGHGSAFTKGKRHKSQRERSNRRKSK
jgi:hypothetical protein